jgi:hypothetical protein
MRFGLSVPCAASRRVRNVLAFFWRRAARSDNLGNPPHPMHPNPVPPLGSGFGYVTLHQEPAVTMLMVGFAFLNRTERDRRPPFSSRSTSVVEYSCAPLQPP